MAYSYSIDRSRPGSYHVWARAKRGVWLFRDDEDREQIEELINRHLSRNRQLDTRGRAVVNLREEVRLLARNLLSSHYHLVIWQKVEGGIERLMRRVIAAYTRYYNRKYGTSGTLFDGPFRSDLLIGRKRLLWCIAYVVANHNRELLQWRFSTHRLMIAPESAPSWLEREKVLKTFGGLAAYEAYMARYLKRKQLDNDLRVDRPGF